jgi:tRNA1Val (adenine37-N6)-methyltransferase
MPNPYFSFKQFTVYHDRCAMKVGTDGVLLGAWADVVSARNILDIGTGTGLISLMMAQRCNARIRAVDIDADAVEQARGNVAASPWQDRIEVELQDICHFTSETLFDVIVSNPPYFTDSLKCPGKQRNIARHTDFLDFDKLAGSAARLLHPEGVFSVIIPADGKESFLMAATRYGLHLSHQTFIHTKPGVMHYDGDPIMGGKDIEVELIPHGLNIIVSDKKKENEPFSLLQQISEIFSGMKPKAETFAFRHSHLFELNKSLLRRLSKKQ